MIAARVARGGVKAFAGLPKSAVTAGCVDLLGLVLPWFVPEKVAQPLPD